MGQEGKSKPIPGLHVGVGSGSPRLQADPARNTRIGVDVLRARVSSQDGYGDAMWRQDQKSVMKKMYKTECVPN